MAVVSRVAVELTTGPAVAAARKLQGGVDRLRSELDRIPPVNKRVAASFRLAGKQGISALRDLESNANRVAKSIGGLRGVVGKTVIAFAAFKATQAGIARAESERRIKLLGERFGEVAQLQAAAAQAAEKFNLSQTESNQAIANTFARLRPLGVSLADITSTFNGFRTAAVLGGATAAEASASFTQLSQALGSGALRGDEFRSVSEQAPLVLQAISDETGIAAGSLKEYAAEGLLTSDIVIKALKRIESEGAGRLEQALSGPAAKIKEFQNASEEVQVALTETVIPELSKSFVILADVINGLKPVIQSVGSFAAKVLGGVNETIQRIRDPGKLAAEQQAFFAEGRMKAAMKGGQRGLANLPANYAKDEAALFAAAGAPSVAASAPKGRSPLKPLKSKSSGTSDKDADNAEKIAKASADRVQSLEDQTLLASALTQEELRQFENQIKIRELLENKQGLTQTQLNAELEGLTNLQAQVEATQQIKEENAARLQQAEDLKEKEKALAEAQAAAAEKLQQTYNQIGESIASGVVDTLSAAVDQTKSLADAAANTLRNVASILLKLGVNTALQSTGLGIFSGLAGFANGGRPPVGKPSIVGERGPELFVPNTSGTIVPNGKFGGGGGATNVVVNVDAKGSSASGDSGAGKQLGGLIGAAVQAELIKQQRPGGLLSR